MFIQLVKILRFWLLVLLVLPVSGYAGDSDEWVFTATSYLWVTGQEGEVATWPPAAPAELDISFSDVVEDMDMALMGFLEARHGRFGVFGEVFYVGVSDDGKTPGRFFSGVSALEVRMS